MVESDTGAVAPEHGVVATDPKVPQDVVDRAVETARVLAGWHIFPEREEELVVLVPGDGQVILPTKRLISVDTIQVDGREIDPSRLVFDESGVVWVPGLKPRRDGVPRRVVSKVRHGYSNPTDLIGVIQSMAARATQPQSSYSVGRISVGAPGSATPQSTEWRVLDLYKLGARP